MTLYLLKLVSAYLLFYVPVAYYRLSEEMEAERHLCPDVRFKCRVPPVPCENAPRRWCNNPSKGGTHR